VKYKPNHKKNYKETVFKRANHFTTVYMCHLKASVSSAAESLCRRTSF